MKFKEEIFFYATITEKSFCKMESAEFWANLRSVCFLSPDNSACAGGDISVQERKRPFLYPVVILDITERWL